MKDPQRCLGSTREQAARKALSIRRSFGRPTLRESTFYLVPKDDDLDLQFAIRARTTGPDHAAEQCVEESEQHEPAMLHRRWSGRRVRENVPSAIRLRMRTALLPGPASPQREGASRSTWAFRPEVSRRPTGGQRLLASYD
jgi:hypothetical protein